MFIGGTDAKAETPILWPLHEKSWLIRKDRDAGRDWGQEEKGTTEDEMAGWHHQLDGLEFEWTLGVSDGQGGLAGCDSWACRVGHDWATEVNWNLDNVICQLLLSCKVVSLLPPHGTVASQAPLSMGFSRQEYWSGLPFPSPGHPPDAGMKPTSPTLAGGFLTTEPPGKPCMSITSQ